MEVNKPEAIISLNRDGKKSLGKKNNPGQRDESEDNADNPAQRGYDEDAFLVDGGLSGPISPEIQSILDGLAAQIEPLRQELDRATARAEDIHKSAERHSYLPVFSRYGLEHEFTKITGHLHSLGAVTFICISVLNAESLRREHGRALYEQAMVHVCNLIRQINNQADSLAGLGGHDLGVLILASTDQTIANFSEKLHHELTQQPFNANGILMTLEVSIGGTPLNSKSTLINTLVIADNNQQ